MPAPTSYTESALIGFMETELGPTGVALGLLETDGLLQAAWAVHRLLGVSNLTAETDMVKLEAAARWKAWEAAEAAAINGVDLKSDGDEIKLSQRLTGIRNRLAVVKAAWCTLVEDAEDADCGFDIAEMVTGPFGYRERIYNEALRYG
jgi:hypothetical protein